MKSRRTPTAPQQLYSALPSCIGKSPSIDFFFLLKECLFGFTADLHLLFSSDKVAAKRSAGCRIKRRSLLRLLANTGDKDRDLLDGSLNGGDPLSYSADIKDSSSEYYSRRSLLWLL